MKTMATWIAAGAGMIIFLYSNFQTTAAAQKQEQTVKERLDRMDSILDRMDSFQRSSR